MYKAYLSPFSFVDLTPAIKADDPLQFWEVTALWLGQLISINPEQLLDFMDLSIIWGCNASSKRLSINGKWSQLLYLKKTCSL